MATQAAGAPFQMPAAPVAGFTPFQQQYFNAIQGMQGMAQPYFATGQDYLQQSAAPVTGQDVAGYYNPMASNVFANLQDIFGQQMMETTGQATQTAGGVGADRIGVAQAQLAKQQGLSAGQTAAGLYQQALTAAEQQKQMEAGAGYGIAQMGPAAQAAQLQGIGALGGAGAQQQQLTQAQLNALYQQQLAGIAYPFQTAQYLAGITGGLAPAMGGTTYGTGTTTQPSPTLAAQLLGVGTGAAGLAGAANQAGLFGSGTGMKGATTPYGLTTADAGSNYGYYGGVGFPIANRGGRISPHPFAEGGEVIPFPMQGNPNDFLIWDENVDKAVQKHIARRNPEAQSTRATISRVLGGTGNVIPFHPFDPRFSEGSGGAGGNLPPFFQSGGAAQDESIPPIPGVALPKTGGLSPIPYTSLPMGSGQFHNTLNLNPPTQQKSGSGSDLGTVVKAATAIIPFLKEGGAVNPFDAYQSFQGGGDAEDTPTQLAFNRDASVASDAGDILSRAAAVTKQQESGGNYANVTTTRNRQGTSQSAIGAYGVMDFNVGPWTKEVLGKEMTPEQFRSDPAAQDAVYRAKMGQYISQYGPEGAGRAWLGGPGGVNNPLATDPLGTSVGSYGQKFAQALNQNPMATGPNADMTAGQYMLPAADRPYPGALEQDAGQRMTRSPWMALVAAGAQMAQTRGPIGSVIGAGMGAGAKELEGQRKELRSEQEINMKAQQLYQQAAEHLDEYKRQKPMTEYQAMEAAKPVVLAQTIDALGRVRQVYGQRMPDGTYIDPITRKKIDPENITGISGPIGGITPEGEGTTPEEAAKGVHAVGTHPEVLDDLKKQDPGMAATVKAIAEGRQNLQSAAYKDKTLLARYVNLYDPNWNQQVFQARQRQLTDLTSAGNAGKMILAVNQLWPHLETASRDAEALHNTNYPAENTVANWIAKQTGDPRIAKFESVREVAALDAARLLRGSGQMAEKDIEQWRQLLSTAGSPKQLQGVISQLADDLMTARIGSIEQSYRTIMGKEPPKNLISDEARAALNKIKERSAAVETKQPVPPAAERQPGIYDTPRGKMKWTGTGWVNP